MTKNRKLRKRSSRTMAIEKPGHGSQRTINRTTRLADTRSTSCDDPRWCKRISLTRRHAHV